MRRLLPRYSALVEPYPGKHDISTKGLLDEIGGEVRRSLNNSVNTCAIRMSYCLNRVGDGIRRTPGLYQLSGFQPSDSRTKPDLYIIRAKEMRRYFDANYGVGRLIYDAAKAPTDVVGIKTATQGVIVFD